MAISTVGGIGGEGFYIDLFTKMAPHGRGENAEVHRSVLLRAHGRRAPRGRPCSWAEGDDGSAALAGGVEARADASLLPSASDARTHSAERVAQKAPYRVADDCIAPDVGWMTRRSRPRLLGRRARAGSTWR
jgi:hypothetical protein